MPTIHTGMSRVDRTGGATWGFCGSVPRGTRQWNQKKKKPTGAARGSEVHPTRDDLSQPTR
jgi:hypothetical protein